MTMTGRRGFTLVEALVAVLLLGLILGVLFYLQRGASKGNLLATDHSEALRASMVALESVQREVDRMLYQCPERDLVMLAHSELGPGSGVALRVPADVPGAHPWEARHVPVSFTLRRTPAKVPAYLLVRTETDTGRETVMRGHLLADLKVRLIPRGTATAPSLSPFCAYLEVVATGLGSGEGTARYTASSLLPLMRLGPPEDLP